MGGVIFQMYNGLIESQLFIIWTKYISLERSAFQDSIFGGNFVIRVTVGEKLMHL